MVNAVCGDRVEVHVLLDNMICVALPQPVVHSQREMRARAHSKMRGRSRVLKGRTALSGHALTLRVVAIAIVHMRLALSAMSLQGGLGTLNTAAVWAQSLR